MNFKWKDSLVPSVGQASCRIPKRERHMRGKSWKVGKMDMGLIQGRPLRGLQSYPYPGTWQRFLAEILTEAYGVRGSP